MTDKSLRAFYNDSETRDNVHVYLIEFMKEEAVKQLFEEESEFNAIAVSHAKKFIDLAFDNMDLLFGKKVVTEEPINHSR